MLIQATTKAVTIKEPETNLFGSIMRKSTMSKGLINMIKNAEKGSKPKKKYDISPIPKSILAHANQS